MNKYCVIIYGSILMLFSPFFSKMIAISGALWNAHLDCQVVPQCSLNCGQELRKVQKLMEKIAERFEEKNPLG